VIYSHLQVGLSLDDGTTQEALRLFRASKYLLKANIGTIGTGTVSHQARCPWFLLLDLVVLIFRIVRRHRLDLFALLLNL
jgi:hypothetical protein